MITNTIFQTLWLDSAKTSAARFRGSGSPERCRRLARAFLTPRRGQNNTTRGSMPRARASRGGQSFSPACSCQHTAALAQSYERGSARPRRGWLGPTPHAPCPRCQPPLPRAPECLPCCRPSTTRDSRRFSGHHGRGTWRHTHPSRVTHLSPRAGTSTPNTPARLCLALASDLPPDDGRRRGGERVGKRRL